MSVGDFKKIPGFEDYEINSHGEVYSLKCNSRKLIKTCKKTENFHYVHILNREGVQKKVSIQKAINRLFGVPRKKRAMTQKIVIENGVVEIRFANSPKEWICLPSDVLFKIINDGCKVEFNKSGRSESFFWPNSEQGVKVSDTTDAK